MSKVRSKNTAPEVELARILRPLGMRLFRHKALPGRPDLASKKRKLAIFMDGCFWHRCPQHYRRPKTRPEFWMNKVNNNVKRDRRANRKLKKMGYVVIRFWEHELSNPDMVQRKVLKKTGR